MEQSDSHQQIGYILRSYPRLSQTFILNEILTMEDLGLSLQIFAITDPQEKVQQEQPAQIRAPVYYLDTILRSGSLARAVSHLKALRASPRGYLQALFYILKEKELDSGYHADSRFTCFQYAVGLAARLRELNRKGTRVTHLHAHFAHDPAFVAQLAHLLTGIPFSFTAHARDLYQVQQRPLADRASLSQAVVTCCGINRQYLDRFLTEPARSKVRVIYHGVDLETFKPRVNQTDPAPPLILSIGRLVEKKGFPDLISAFQKLAERQIPFQAEIFGDGPLQEELNEFIERMGLKEHVKLRGSLPQSQLVGEYQRASLFALAPSVTADGDRDGIPNVLVEAMACGLPVVSTSTSGISELVAHNTNGLLVEPHDIASLASCIEDLLKDPSKRKRLGASARQTVVERFDLRSGASQMAALFHQDLQPTLNPLSSAV